MTDQGTFPETDEEVDPNQMGLGFPSYSDNGFDAHTAVIDVEVPPEHEYQGPTSSGAWAAVRQADEHIQAYNDTQPPGGYYTVESFKVTESEREAEFWVRAEDGFQKVKRPRTINTYSGKGYQVTETKTWEPRIRVRISPIPAFGKNADGSVNPDKLDGPYKMFSRALQAYKEVMGEVPKTEQDFLDYLATYPFKVRTMQAGNGDLIVLDIQGIKPA